jgi:hypothetical protein
MTPMPIIIPINSHGGSIEPRDVGFILLSLVAIILWFTFIFWIAKKIEDNYYIDWGITVLFGGIVLPLIIGGLMLIF